MAVVRLDGAGAEDPPAETIEELFLALESPLLVYAQRLSGRFDLAEDMVQEAFVRLHSQFDQVRAPRSWLYRTVHNLALNSRRTTDRQVPMERPDEETGVDRVSFAMELTDPQPLPDEQIARLESVGLVRLNLELLDPRSRELIRLKFTEDLSYKEIAERTGLTVGHVGYLLQHSLKALAADLAKAGLMP
jgi:RNA polymerase sigma-70 factor (ECF subfamily)